MRFDVGSGQFETIAAPAARPLRRCAARADGFLVGAHALDQPEQLLRVALPVKLRVHFVEQAILERAEQWGVRRP